MAGRMSALHDPSVLSANASIGAISTAANTLNGATVSLARGKRGALFVLNIGVLTGAANVSAYLQTNDTPADPTNGTWSNVNATTYPNAAISIKGNGCTDHQNTAWLMSYDGSTGGSYVVRAVRVTAVNTAVTSISHIIY